MWLSRQDGWDEMGIYGIYRVIWKNMALHRPPQIVMCPQAGQSRVCLHMLHIFPPACTSLHTGSAKPSKPSYPGSPTLALPACVLKWSCSTMTGRAERVGGCFHVPLLAGQNKKPLFFGSWSVLTASGYNPFWWHHRYCWGRQGDVTIRSLWL